MDRFRTVILDFRGVATIGQSFADEIFRVFARQHEDMELLAIDANEEVARAITRAKANT